MTAGDGPGNEQWRQDIEAGRDNYVAGRDLTINGQEMTINIHYPPGSEHAQAKPVGPKSTAESYSPKPTNATNAGAAHPGSSALLLALQPSELSTFRVAVAHARFLATLKPHFPHAETRQHLGYDTAQVDEFMTNARTLASGNMTELRTYLSVTSRDFKRYNGKGYRVLEIDSFMEDLDNGMVAYVREATTAIPFSGRYAHLGRDGPDGETPEQERQRLRNSFREITYKMDGARAQFADELKRDFRRGAGYQTCYDAAQVDNFMLAARVLTNKEMPRIQAYIALTPRNFRMRKGKGYATQEVDDLLRNLDAISALYEWNMSLLFGVDGNSNPRDWKGTPYH